MSGSGTRETNAPDVALKVNPSENEAVSNIRLSAVNNGGQVEGRLPIAKPRTDTGSGCIGTHRSYDFGLFSDEDGDNPTLTRDQRHLKLLEDGWQPIRWRHPECGDVELVTSDGFWLSTDLAGGGVVMGPSEKALAAINAGRTRFVRDKDGNLVAEVWDESES